jgi:large subunit ribosomal protein L4
MKIQVVDQKGKVAEEIVVSNAVFAVDLNAGLIHEVATAQRNNARQGTKCTQTRSEVRGHAKKPYRQKGTGNARQGSTKAPHYDGGGVAFAPKPRDFSTKINKKKKSAAFVSAISAKLNDKELVVIKNTKLSAAKTKNVAAILEALKIGEKSAMFVTAGYDADFLRSVKNLPNASVTVAEQLSVLDIVNHKFIVASVDAIRAIETTHSVSDDKIVSDKAKVVSKVEKKETAPAIKAPAVKPAAPKTEKPAAKPAVAKTATPKATGGKK